MGGLGALEFLYCDSTNISALDVRNNPALEELYCYSTNISALNLSGCVMLNTLNLTGNPLADLTTPDGYRVEVRAAGNGTARIADYGLASGQVSLAASPASGASFLGWTALRPAGLAFSPDAASLNASFTAAQSSAVQGNFSALPTPTPTRKPSALPRTGDSFPMAGLLALAGGLAAALGALAVLGGRARRRRG